jgi:hypothetical protein
LFLPFKEERKVRVANNTEQKNPRQAKSAFIIRNTPAWLDQCQSWISDGARRLYKTLRTLADAKTGRLLIPGRGWIRLRTVEQKAGMCTRTRKKYMRELRILGGVSEHRDRVTRSIRGRNRKVLGQAQITVLPLHAPNPHKQRASTTVQNGEKANPEPQHSVPTTVQSTTVQGENGLLGCKSCTVQEVHPQVLSETTNGPGAKVLGLGFQKGSEIKGAQFQKAPSTAPPRALTPFETEKQKLVQALEMYLRHELSGPTPDLHPIRKWWQSETDDFGIPFRESRKLYEQAFERVQISLAPIPCLPAVPFDFATAKLDPDVLESRLDPDGTAVLIYEHGIQFMRTGASEPEWHPY